MVLEWKDKFCHGFFKEILKMDKSCPPFYGIVIVQRSGRIRIVSIIEGINFK